MAEKIRVNGTEATFNDVKISANSGKVAFSFSSGLEEFNYDDGFERGSFSGQSPYEEGWTVGDYKPTASAVWKQSTWDNIEAKLGPLGGVFGTLIDSITLVYTDKAKKTHSTVITDVTFDKRKFDGKRGSDPLKASIDLGIHGKIYREGFGPLGEAVGA